jgi:hypothetical protein
MDIIGDIASTLSDFGPYAIAAVVLVWLWYIKDPIVDFYKRKMELDEARAKADGQLSELIRNNTAALENSSAALTNNTAVLNVIKAEKDKIVDIVVAERNHNAQLIENADKASSMRLVHIEALIEDNSKELAKANTTLCVIGERVDR